MPGARGGDSARGSSAPEPERGCRGRSRTPTHPRLASAGYGSWDAEVPGDSHGWSRSQAPHRGVLSRKRNVRPRRFWEADARQAPGCSEASVSKVRPFPSEFLPGNQHVAFSAWPGEIGSSWGLGGSQGWAEEGRRGPRSPGGIKGVRAGAGRSRRARLCRKQGPGKIPSASSGFAHAGRLLQSTLKCKLRFSIRFEVNFDAKKTARPQPRARAMEAGIVPGPGSPVGSSGQGGAAQCVPPPPEGLHTGDGGQKFTLH